MDEPKNELSKIKVLLRPEKSMRTTQDLFADMQADALALKLDGKKTVVGVQLIIRFKDREEVYIAHDHPEALDFITACVINGAEPIGKLIVTKDETGWHMKVKALPEWRGDKEAEAFLSACADKLSSRIMEFGCFDGVRDLPPSPSDR